jgi:peroxiredoxin
MTIRVGDRIPDVTLYTMKDGKPEAVQTGELFKGKKVAFFGVPGAFTPTCSQKHLPNYVQGAEALKGKQVDQIVCMAVNDVFVLDAWGREQNVGDKVMMLSDGNGAFTKAAGLELDLSGRGLGTRCQRFSMFVDDGVVKSVNVEEAAGNFDKTSCEILAKQI